LKKGGASYKRIYEQYTQVDEKTRQAENTLNGLMKLISAMIDDPSSQAAAQIKINEQQMIIETLRTARGNLEVKLNELYNSESLNEYDNSNSQTPDSSYLSNSYDTSSPELADGWKEVFDENGNKYYYNEQTFETQWNFPEYDKSNSVGEISDNQFDQIYNNYKFEALPANWTELLDESGNIYYLNQVTNETTWDRPYEQIKKKRKKKKNQLKKKE